MRYGRVVLGVLVLAGFAVGGHGAEQAPQQPSPFGVPDASGRNGHGGERDPASERAQEQLAKGRNSDRQKRLVADTETLLRLATELKQDVDRTDKNTLSVDVIKKADEIEKLAHSVKERMKG